MGKNQGYKAMQRAKVGSSSAAPDEIEDGMVDGSYHSPDWHAAHLASLKTTHTITWEEYKKKQKRSRRHSSDSRSSSSSSQLSSSDEEESRRSSSKREKKHKSKGRHSSHVPLSKFFGSLKS